MIFFRKYWDVMVVFSLSWIMMTLMTTNYVPADQRLHAECAKNMFEEGRLLSGNFLMYLLVNLLSGMCGEIDGIIASLILLLSFSLTWKYTLTKHYLQITSSKDTHLIAASLSMMVIYVIPLISFAKTFFGSGGVVAYYYGYAVPTLWHNSTIICSLPFCILIYFKSLSLLDSPNTKSLVELTVLTLVNIFIKPSFFFPFLISYPILLFSRYCLHKEFWMLNIPSFVGLAALLYQYITIYQLCPSDESGVYLSVLELTTIEFWVDHGIYLICSLLFPCIFILLFSRQYSKSIEYRYVVLLLVSSIFIYLLCHESGTRENDGNFYWQIVPCFWLFLFYVWRVAFANNSKKTIILRSLFYLHIGCGVFYLFHMLYFQTYW